MYTNHRRIWIEHNGLIPKDEHGRSYHIHHVDGDHTNNDISNLRCLSPIEHYKLHRDQGDFGAATFLMKNHLKISPEERSVVISLSNKSRWKSYTTEQKRTIILRNRISNIETWKSESLRKRSGEKIRIAHSNKTEDKLKQESKNKSNSSIVSWKTDSHEAHRIHMSTVVECPHCKKTGQKAAMYRYHFKRCKLNERRITN